MKSWLINKRMLTIPFFGFYLWLVIETAWISDDAFITFRSMENFLHGYGPVFNIGERVQTFTHPLWFLLQSTAGFIFNFWKDNPFGQGQMYFRNIFILALLAALGGLDRLDTLLFYMPALIILFWQSQNKGKTFVSIGLGFL